MPSDVNWGKLVARDRVKAVGVPWSEAEKKAINEYHISPDDVRAGILTPEQLENEPTGAETRLERLKKAELVERANALGIVFDPDKVTRETLILEIRQAEERRDNATENPKSTGTLPSEAGLQGNEGSGE